MREGGNMLMLMVRGNSSFNNSNCNIFSKSWMLYILLNMLKKKTVYLHKHSDVPFISNVRSTSVLFALVFGKWIFFFFQESLVFLGLRQILRDTHFQSQCYISFLFVGKPRSA